jgi:hypothetical protein
VTKSIRPSTKPIALKPQLASGVEVIELDHLRVQEHFRGRSKVDTVLIPVGQLLDAVPFEVHRPDFGYTDIQYLIQGRHALRSSLVKACVYRKPKRELIGDEVRQGYCVNL